MPWKIIAAVLQRGARWLTSMSPLLLTAFLFAAGGTAEARSLRLMAFGDSLVHGYGLAEQDTFPAQLEEALQERDYDVQVLNAGNSGDTTAAGLARLAWALADNPDAVLVVLGANDALRGLDPDETYHNLSSLLDQLEERRLPTLFAGMMAPRNMGSDYAFQFDRLFPQLADEHSVIFYPFFLEDVAADPELNQDDGMHPNAAGVARIVAGMLPAVEELLAQAADQVESKP